jgi:hypothetical protein
MRGMLKAKAMAAVANDLALLQELFIVQRWCGVEWFCF